MTDWIDELQAVNTADLGTVFDDNTPAAFDEPFALWRRTRHAAEDRRGASNARQLIDRLPEPSESCHLLWSGQWRHAHTIPVILDLAGCHCRQLSISTLGYDQRCADLLIAELDAKRLQRVDMLSCVYHQAHYKDLDHWLTAELAQRGSRHAASKTHAKVLSFQLADGRAVVVESSSNLRSCAMLELSTISGDPDLARFHSAWIDNVLGAT